MESSDSSHPTCTCEYRPYNGTQCSFQHGHCVNNNNLGVGHHGNHGRYNVPSNNPNIDNNWLSDSEESTTQSLTRAPELLSDYFVKKSKVLKRFEKRPFDVLKTNPAYTKNLWERSYQLHSCSLKTHTGTGSELNQCSKKCLHVKDVTYKVESFSKLMQDLSTSFIPIIFQDNSHVMRRVVWTLLWVLCVGYALSNIQTAFSQFMSYDSDSQLSFIYEPGAGGLALPAITICNMNKYRKSVLARPDFTALDKYEKAEVWGEDSVDITDDDNIQAQNIIMSDLERVAKHSLDNMFYEVSFDGRDLTDLLGTGELFLAQSTEMGVCYSFNPNGDRIVKRTGNDYGATFTININQSEYADTQESAGIKIMLHDFRVPPLIKEYGLAIPPGSEAYISTRAVEIVNLGEPYMNCSNRALRTFEHYSVIGCTLECYSDILYKACGCKMPHMPLVNISTCDLYTHRTCTELEMTKIHQGRYNAQIDSCGCVDSCNSTTYSYSMSRAEYPSLAAGKIIAETFNRPLEELRDNFIRLHVYFETLAKQRIEKVPSYTVTNLLGDVGGNLGLFIGANVATLAELLDYISRRTFALVVKYKR